MQTAFRSEERFTQEEFWEWLRERPPSDVNHYELIDGCIVMSPPAGWPHGSVDAAVVQHLRAHVVARRIGTVFGSRQGFDFPSGDTLEPDASVVSTERMAAGPPPTRGRFLRVVPELVVEILSGASERRDRVEKREVYARNGVEEDWLVDTAHREVTVLCRGRKGSAWAASSPRGAWRRACSRVSRSTSRTCSPTCRTRGRRHAARAAAVRCGGVP